MSMRERAVAKYSFLLGAPFLIVAFFGSYLGAWNYPFSDSSPSLLNWAVRLIWGIGFSCLFVNLIIMWRHMFRNKKWAWLLSTFVAVFISSLIYYKVQYTKHGATNI